MNVQRPCPMTVTYAPAATTATLSSRASTVVSEVTAAFTAVTIEEEPSTSRVLEVAVRSAPPVSGAFGNLAAGLRQLEYASQRKLDLLCLGSVVGADAE